MAACQARSQLALNLDTYNPSYFYEVMRFIFMQKISMLTLNVKLKKEKEKGHRWVKWRDLQG
jgi:hypothetical protein